MARKVGRSFSVDDPPSTLDPNLPDVAKFLSVHFENNSDFYKFGAELVNDKKIDVKVIQQDLTKPKLGDKCLGLIELWISSVKAPKWQDLVEAASKSGFNGLATALTEELDSQKEPLSGSVKKLDIRDESGYGEGKIKMSAKDAIKHFNVELLRHLPLEDDIFFAMANRANLFPLDVSNSIAAEPTRAKKVAYFLQHVIEPGAEEYLPTLLKVMKESKVADTVRLANDIQAATGIGH